jgi:hypothetical protein
MIPHPLPGQTPEGRALDIAEVHAQLAAGVAAAKRVGITRAQLVSMVTQEWTELEHIQVTAAAEAGRNAARRRGPRAKGGR